MELKLVTEPPLHNLTTDRMLMPRALMVMATTPFQANLTIQFKPTATTTSNTIANSMLWMILGLIWTAATVATVERRSMRKSLNNTRLPVPLTRPPPTMLPPTATAATVATVATVKRKRRSMRKRKRRNSTKLPDPLTWLRRLLTSLLPTRLPLKRLTPTVATVLNNPKRKKTTLAMIYMEMKTITAITDTAKMRMRRKKTTMVTMGTGTMMMKRKTTTAVTAMATMMKNIRTTTSTMGTAKRRKMTTKTTVINLIVLHTKTLPMELTKSLKRTTITVITGTANLRNMKMRTMVTTGTEKKRKMRIITANTGTAKKRKKRTTPANTGTVKMRTTPVNTGTVKKRKMRTTPATTTNTMAKTITMATSTKTKITLAMVTTPTVVNTKTRSMRATVTTLTVNTKMKSMIMIRTITHMVAMAPLLLPITPTLLRDHRLLTPLRHTVHNGDHFPKNL